MLQQINSFMNQKLFIKMSTRRAIFDHSSKIENGEISKLKQLVNLLSNYPCPQCNQINTSQRSDSKNEIISKDLLIKINELQKEKKDQMHIYERKIYQLEARNKELEFKIQNNEQKSKNRLMEKESQTQTLTKRSRQIKQQQIAKTQYKIPQQFQDKLLKLSSYLIEYNTNIKLLIEKCSYLIKIRSLKNESLNEERQILEKSKSIFENNKKTEQILQLLKSIIYKSEVYASERSDNSSEIQIEVNEISEPL